MKIVLTALLIYSGIALYLYVAQRSLLYFPTPPVKHPFIEEFLDIDGESIVVISANPDASKALIYFGGNAEAVAYSIPDFQGLQDTTLYMVNYRGYGGSSGSPSEAGLYADALAVYDAIAPRHSEVMAMGRSLGTGVATWLSVNRDISKLVLITPYDSVLNVAQRRFPIFPAKIILKDVFDSLSRAQALTVPMLVLAAENDNVIPVRHAENLVTALDSNLTEFHILPGTGHNNISAHPEYSRQLLEFLNN